MSSNWYETFFSGLALEFWRDVVTPEMTRAEVDFLMARLDLDGRAHVLDVPCGNGRHALELARRGVRVTGVDLAPEFVHEARARAGANGLADFERADMRDLTFDARFDAAYCFGNSFGYTEYAGTRAFLSAVSRALKNGAGFALDTGTAAESLLPTLRPAFSMTAGGVTMSVENTYVAVHSRLDTEYRFARGDECETKHSRHHLHTVAEIRRMLEDVHLSVEGIWSSTSGEPYSVGARRLLLVARKGGGSPPGRT
jgi:SAM-dependent methyltransferase